MISAVVCNLSEEAALGFKAIWTYDLHVIDFTGRFALGKQVDLS